MLIAVDKPLELTSFDVVKRMKHLFPGEKIGHSGTLDPKATGLMLLGIGKGTKRLTSLIGLDKTYETTLDFSQMSDTWDLGYREKYVTYPLSAEGRGGIVKDGQTVLAPSLEEIRGALDKLIPSYALPLPAFSAKKKEGKRLYQLARAGQEFSETRIMHVHTFEILQYTFPVLSLRLAVGSGTYIRSIGYRLGQQWGLGGILTALRRISIGEWSLETLPLSQTVAYHMRGNEGSFTWGVIEE